MRLLIISVVVSVAAVLASEMLSQAAIRRAAGR
jgi:hypothetical protein